PVQPQRVPLDGRPRRGAGPVPGAVRRAGRRAGGTDRGAGRGPRGARRGAWGERRLPGTARRRPRPGARPRRGPAARRGQGGPHPADRQRGGDPVIPGRLVAPEPGWTASADVVVVGSGIAGLSTALQITRHSSLSVMLVTKDVLAAGSTRWAQGGIAAALGAGDSPEQHLADTLVAGAGVCDEDAVRVLVREGPAAVRDLVALGTRFDRRRDGELSLGREGGHHRDRIAHAGGDATGAEIERALVTRVLDASGVEIVEHA